ncbi:uncharacterized protein BDR25DRAFT_325730 [Lindgomyces ingoldianus]|uniref:Uncharacterized protein n=1 Tax=Lindgomyces ingoldianus TaxID=673940 RepID=A0ACB6QV71_9PLEO|nr:uncharacterized protein BDR25DRAFT_325730 [Lindgomyces ingoldianus]KAF2469970.1 hypothetical protein BDR25DRAFT_325730 [Lindgomyces ingoldianus]
MDIPQGLPSGLPMPPSFPLLEEVRQKARSFSEKLLKDWQTLNAIIERHKEVIRKRWISKSKGKREQILLDAWPNMSTKHRPDVESYLQGNPARHSMTTKFQEAYMWPYVNLEDLTKPNLLSVFLNSRGRKYPHEFVHSDLELAALVLRLVGSPAFLNEYTMLFLGRTTAQTYGELMSWDEDDKTFDSITKGIGMHPGHGLQALEIQQRIWEFLLRHVLALVALEAPYRIPTHLDFTWLKGVASAERNTMEDHLWALREDSNYFADVMRDYVEHRQEMIVDEFDQKHPSLIDSGRPVFWNRVLGNVIGHAYFGFATFDEIRKQVIALEALGEKYKDQIRLHQALPPEYMNAFQNPRFLLEAASKDVIQQLQIGVLPSPPIRPFCSRKPQDPHTTRMLVSYKPPSAHHPTKRRLMEIDQEVKALVSPWVAGRISQLSMISESLHQLYLYQPGLSDELHQSYKQTFSGWIGILNTKFEQSNLYRLADPSDRKFAYPTNKRRNKQNVNTMRKAEAHLDEFWNAIDCYYKTKGVSSQHDMIAHLLAQERSIQRTPRWVDTVKNKETPGQLEYIYQPFSPVYRDRSKEITSPFRRTRGEPLTTVDSPGPAEPLPQDAVEQEPVFTVDRRAYKVFKALFHSPLSLDIPGEVLWRDFLHAMISVGFSVEKLHASASNFMPHGLYVERSIQFHEPHHTHKIPLVKARQIGKRLGRAYRWTRSMFRLS